MEEIARGHRKREFRERKALEEITTGRKSRGGNCKRDSREGLAGGIREREAREEIAGGNCGREKLKEIARGNRWRKSR